MPARRLLAAWRRWWVLAALPLSLAIQCDADTALPTLPTCTIAAELSVAEGMPGTVVVSAGGPQTEPRDTVVEVGGEPAGDVAVTRTDCEACDTCRADAGCTVCEACADCDTACADCTEAVSFTVPEGAAPGPGVVRIVNATGRSADVPFTVLPADGDTGAGDTGDTAVGDTGAGDTGDTAVGDTGAGDTAG